VEEKRHLSLLAPLSPCLSAKSVAQSRLDRTVLLGSQCQERIDPRAQRAGRYDATNATAHSTNITMPEPAAELPSPLKGVPQNR
jgi:hypothetical protein